MKPKVLQFLLALSVILYAGCAATSIYVPVTRPAELNITAYAPVCAGLFFNEANWQFSGSPDLPAQDLEDHLLRDLPEHAGIEIQNLRDLESHPGMRNLLKSGYPTPVELTIIRKHNGSNGWLTGRITTLRYDEEINRAEIRQSSRKPAFKHVRTGILRMTVEFCFYNIKTPALLYRETLNTRITTETRETNNDPPAIDPESMRIRATDQLLSRFFEKVKWMTEKTVVTFLTDREYPGIARGIRQAQLGNWAKAVGIFSRILDSAGIEKDGDKLLYNLGIAQQYNHNFRGALHSFERANTINENRRYLNAIEELLIMEQEYQELMRQKRSEH